MEFLMLQKVIDEMIITVQEKQAQIVISELENK